MRRLTTFSPQDSSSANSHRSSKAGFTLVELLVVIAIIGILVALLLPAVQAAREAARRSQCKNQLKQMGLACLLHEDALGYFPSGGWGTRFIAEPNHGYGKDQPGSWYYSVFSYLEENTLRDLGKGETIGSVAWQNAIRELISTPIATFNCPSRRNIALQLHDSGALAPEFAFVNAGGGIDVVKGDYAGNSGDSRRHASTGLTGSENIPHPSSLAAAENYDWPNTSRPLLPSGAENGNYQNGVICFRSEVKMSQITDGASKTYLIGEKFVAPKAYDNSEVYQDVDRYGDNQSMYAGYEWDNQRVAWRPQAGPRFYNAPDEFWQPSQDNDNQAVSNLVAFGSAHSGGLNMTFCDGSVQTVSYDIDKLNHRLQAIRNDDGDPDAKGVQFYR
jgi:prepilin-type N-terminal cleavage/methylation domain-containing protein/prepilin-type processing-associated H-X9-DG protein